MDNSTISNITALNYTLRNLQEATEYSITVYGILNDGKATDYLRATTLAAGQHCLYIMDSIITGQLFPSAPSAPPTYMKVFNVTSTTITIQWGKVNCKHHNGRIIGYSVRYGSQDNLNSTLSISGESVNMTTISKLRASTTYEIEVAAVNNAGTGAFSPVLVAHTLPSECI